MNGYNCYPTFLRPRPTLLPNFDLLIGHQECYERAGLVRLRNVGANKSTI